MRIANADKLRLDFSALLDYNYKREWIIKVNFGNLRFHDNRNSKCGTTSCF